MVDTRPTAVPATSHGNVPAPALSASLAWQQWGYRLAMSPARQARLAELGIRYWARLANAAMNPFPGQGALPSPARRASNDSRFAGPAWQPWPFNLLSLGFSLQQSWWHEATREVPGLSKRAQRLVAFGARQMLEAMSPANFPATNPDVVAATLREGGANLLRGGSHLAEDLLRLRRGSPTAGALSGATPALSVWRIGSELAATPGRVVHRNRLVELIQYTPATATVFAEPVLLVPGWVTKYHLLDLSPGQSLVEWLVGHGHTVFMVSWINPGARDRDLGLDDYRALGVEQSLQVIGSIAPDRKVHAVGHCLGGTLLAIAAAVLARDGRDRLASLSLFAAQTDFEQPGELEVLIDEAQLRWLERTIDGAGFIDAPQLAAALALLHPGDRLWGRAVRDYLLGRRAAATALSSWAEDGVRVPARVLLDLLRSLYQRDDLAHGRLRAGGRTVSLADIRLPIFLLAAVDDHFAPWQSVYRLHGLTETGITFALVRGGHATGMLPPPQGEREHAAGHYQIATRPAGDPASTPSAQRWRASAPVSAGSWWTAWQQWLAERSSDRVEPPPMGADGLDYGLAPGWYVRSP
jgi:polyhydroxyalkanoate synthase